MRISQHNNIANLDIWKYNGHPRNLNHSMRKQYKKIKVWYRTKHLKSLQTIIATERKHKHKAPDKTCFKHISNQKSWMQTTWFWWLIKLKRILLFSDLSWSNWKESSVSILVNPFTLLVNHVSNTYFWSILHTSGQSLTLLVNHFWSILPMSRLQFLVNPSHF